MKKLALLLLLTFATATNAAPVTWTTSTVSGPSDVNTAGTLVGAMNVGVNTAQTVNGVAFAADTTASAGPLNLGSATVAFGNLGNSFTDFWTASDPGGNVAYAAALDAGRWGNADSGTVTLGGLTVGRSYLVQLWITDTRSGANARVRTVDGTATTSGGPGNIVTGLFVADATTQVITVDDGVATFGPQVNLLQVRDISATIVTTGNSGAGSLRQSLIWAASVAGANTITFAPALSGQTITLTSEIVISDSGGVTVDASALADGVTIHGGPGGNRLFSTSSGTVTLTGLNLTGGGGSSGSGGAVSNTGTLVVNRCTFHGNSAGDGSGGAIHSIGTLTMTQCTLSGNISAVYGGGILATGSVSLNHVTLGNNTAGERGGAIYLGSGTLTLANSAIGGNSALTFPGIENLGTLTRVGTSIVQTAVGGTVNGTGTLTVADPLLGPLGDYGGPTLTMRPRFASPVRDVATTSAITTDQRGFALTGAADAGACEANAALPTISNITDRSIAEDSATAALAFTIGDSETAATALTVSGSSSNTTLVPNGNITFGGSGASRTVTVTPAANQFGTTTITVTVNDGLNTAQDTFLLTVTSVNDAPTLAAISNPAAINEEAPQQTVSLSGIGTGAANETQALTVTATSSNTALIPHPTVSYTSPNTTGSLAYTPVVDANGTATITVTVNDGQAANNTVTRTFTVVVHAVNDAPKLAAIGNPAAINEDAPQQTINLSGISTGAANEAQTLTITATSSNTALIPHPTVSYTSPNTTGSLAYTPVAGVNGSAVINVTVNDGQASNNTLTRTFTVVVTPPYNLVTHTGDNGPGSLRQVVSVMLGFSGSQTITFAPGLSGQTITLASEISLTDPNNTGTDTLTLDASSLPGGLTIDGGPGTNRIFFLAPGDRAVLNGLTLTGGNGVGSVINNSGGAIYNHNGILTLTECTLSGNSVNSTDALGGAIFNSGGTLTLAQCILSDNSVTGTNCAGGAIGNDGMLTLTECTLAGNTTSQSGGAIYNLDSASLARCTLSGNSAIDGGAILNVGTLSLTGCTLAGNSVPSVGGAIYSGSGSLTLTRCTLSGNSANYLAGGIFSQTTVTLTNSLIAGNTAFSAPDIRFNGIVNRSGVNLIGSNDTVTTPFPGGQPNANGDFVGTNAAPLSPQLDVLGSYGGPTQTRRLLAGSPALNRIASPVFATDQRGFPIVGAADIGAYESQVGAIAALAINEDAATGALPFSVGTVGTLTATSSNTALVPNADIILGGSGSSRTLAATPLADANGTTTITVTDSPSGEAASFTLTVTAVNDTPTLNAISNPAAINEDAPQQTINLSGISTGAANETQTLTVTATSSNTALIPHPTVSYTSPNTTGTLAYTPVANASGSAIITVTVNDGQAANNTRVRTFTVVVNAVNDAPVAVADAQTIAPKTSLKFAATKLLANDTDLEGGTLTVVSVQSPTHGATVSLGSGTITYVPAAEFTGVAAFTYTVTDGTGGFAVGLVTITVSSTEKVVLKDTQMRVTSAGTITNAVELDGTGGLTSDQPVTLGGQVTVKGTPVIDTSSNITISGSIDGDGRLEKTGSGRLNLNAASTFTGGFKATQGVVGIGDNAALGTGTVTFGGAGIESVGARRVLANPVEITGNTVVSGPGIGLSGPVKLSGRRGIQTDGNLDIDGPVQDEGGPAKITKRGGGDLILGGENTFSGGVDVKEGTLALAKDAAAGTGPVVLSGGELEAIGDRELDNPVELKADAVLKGDKMKLNGPVAVSGEKTLTTETDVELRGTVKSDTPGTTTKLNKEGKGKLTNASTAKNEVDVEVQDGRYSNEGRSRGTTRAPSDAPAEQADSGLFSSQAIVGGAPAVSFYDKKNGDLKYMRATKQDGSSFSIPITVDATGDVGASTSLLVVDGHPAIAYREGGGSSGRLKYVRANDQWGREWGTPVVVSELKSNSITLQVVSGRPAIAFYASDEGNLCFIRANDVTGASWSTVRTVASEGDVGLQASMVIVNGKPAILCLDATNNQLVYFRATSANDWGAGIKVAGSTAQKGLLSLNSAPRLQVISGRPAVCYVAGVKTSPEAKPVAKLLYKRADDADGATWPAEATTMLTPSGPVGYTSLALVGNVPALSYVKATDSSSNVIECVWAADADGTTWPAANLKTLRVKAGGSSTSLRALADGLAGISFYGGDSTIAYTSFLPEAATTPTTPDERIGKRSVRDDRLVENQPPDSPPDRKKPDTGGKNGKNKPVKDKGSGSNAQAPAPDPGRPPAAGPPPSKPPAKSGGYTSGDYSGKELQEERGSATTRNGKSPGMSEDAEDVIWADGTTIVWDINDASGLPGLNWDYFKVGGLFEIDAASTDPIYFEIESLLPDNTAGPVTHFSPYVPQTWKIVSAGAITGFAADKFVISTEGFANDLKGGGFSLAQSGSDINLVFTPATTLAPEITVLSNSVSLGSGSALDVGTLAASAQTTLSYTVRNDGSGPLSGIRIENASVLIGDGSLTFDVPAATTLAPGASLTFDAILTNEGAAADGLVAAFTITSDDADESIFTLHVTANAAVVPAPEIAVAKTAGNVDLTSGSLTPVNFGNVSTAASAALDFTLANTGSASLSGIDFIIDGPHSIDFHLIAENLSDVDGGASASFQVEFEPSAAGVRQATLFIRSSDADENPFIIHLTGTGDATPEIAVTGAGRSLVDGDPSPVDFGTLAVNAHQDISFSIANIGTLDLTGLTLSLTGADASQFSIQTGLAASTLAPADAAPVVIRFAPASAGVKHANLQITSTDSDEPVFDIALTGEGTVAAELVLENAAAVSLGLNESADFGTVLSGDSAALTFTIKNIGSADLTGLTLSLSGDAAADYSLSALSTPAPLAGPAGVSTFTLTFSPSASGIRNAALLIESNDADEGQFVIYLTGTGTLPPSAPTDILLSNSTVIENAGPGTSIGTLTAVDANLGQSHTFTLVPGTGDTHNTLFGISSGDLVLNANADFESLTTYSIRVQADDGSGGTFAKTFSITVTDANDAPLITSSLGGSSAAISVAENTTAVTTVTASDPDSPAQTLLHSITGGPDAARFAIVPATGVLTFLTAPSFEAPSDLGADNIYEVLITVTDNGSPALSDTQLISVTVTDAPEPEIALSGNAVAILAGDVSHFGDTAVTGGSVVRIFTITNSGLAALTLTGTAPDYVTLSGSGAGHFSITAQPASGTLAAGGTQTFQITFDPSALGTHTATVGIASDDEDENLFTFDIRGNGASSHFTAAVSNWAAANNLAPGDSDPGDDPDGDGKTNLEEFAFGTHPGTGSSGSAAAAYTGSFAAATLTATGQPLSQFEPSSVTGVDFRAVFVRRADHSTLGLTYTVQFSADMTTWQTTTVIPTVLDTAGGMQLVSVPYPLFVKGKRARFFHVVVSQP